MSIKLTAPILVDGASQPVGTVFSIFDAAAEADLVNSGVAVYVVENISAGGELVKVMFDRVNRRVMFSEPEGFRELNFRDAVDPRSYGCKGDGQIVLDATLTLVSGTTYNVSSISANSGFGFNEGDIGKVLAVMNRNASSVSDTPRSGTISAIVNDNQAQVTFGNVPGGTLSNMRCVFGTDDSIGLNQAIASASSLNLPVYIGAMYVVASGISMLDDVNLFGNGPDQKRTGPQDALCRGGAIVCAKWLGAGVPMIKAGLGNGFFNLNLDGFGLCDNYALDLSTNQGKAIVQNCMIFAGNNSNVLCGATVNIYYSSLWAHRASAGPNLVINGGDNRISNCDIAGSGNNQYQIKITASEVQINHCHSWKNSTLNASGRANGGQILIQPANNNAYGIEINNHVFDSSFGAYSHVMIDLANGLVTTAYDISINGCRTLQAAASGHMPIVKLNIPAGKSLKGFTVRGLKGVGDFAMSESAQHTYLVDGSAVAGNIYASETGGGNVVDCAALYNFSATWAAWDKNDGNMILPTYASTAATIG